MNEETTLKDAAQAREEYHRGKSYYTPKSRNHELVGLRGEEAWVREFGGDVDTNVYSGGDKGHDFQVGSYTIDIKTARNAHRLLVKAGKRKYADIFVLARYDDDADRAELVGWAWADDVLSVEPRDTGFGIVNHEYPARKLHEMWSLRALRDNQIVAMSFDEEGIIRYHRD